MLVAEKKEMTAHFEKELTDAKTAMTSEIAKDLEKFKKQLVDERISQVKEFANKNREEIAREVVAQHQHASAIQKAFESKKSAATEKHALGKSALEKEYELKTRLLPEAKILESEKLKTELKFQEQLRDKRQQATKSLFELTKALENEEKVWKAQKEANITKQKEEFTKAQEGKVVIVF